MTFTSPKRLPTTPSRNNYELPKVRCIPADFLFVGRNGPQTQPVGHYPAAMARKRNRQAIAWLKWTASAAGRRLQ